MKFIFIIQGEGRGHFTQALSMKELLRERGDEISAVLVGKSASRKLPDFFIRQIGVPLYTFESPNFLPTPQNKRPPLIKSILFNIRRLPAFISGMGFIRSKINELQPDIVINFYELLTGLTYLFMPPRVPQICIGHQYMFLHKDFSFPRISGIELASLRFFTRLTALNAVKKLALSFYTFPEDTEANISVVPPLLRREVLETRPGKGDYIHGYLLNSGYAGEIKQWHYAHPAQPLHFFWDKKGITEKLEITPALTFHPINDRLFLDYMKNCKAYATTAGFESVCEALFLQKPVLMIPVHVEQACNAFDALHTGAGISSDEFELDALLDYIPRYRPNPVFHKWALSAPSLIYAALETTVKKEEKRSSLLFSLLEQLWGKTCSVI